VRHVTVAPEIKRYILELVTATRRHEDVYVGASPRGSLALFRLSQARAAVFGREYVMPDDIKALAVPALSHRLIVGSAARVRDVDTRTIVQEILRSLPVPGGEIGR
jgi:MoxR-like ATPase